MDHVDLYAAQRNDARRQFGQTNVHLPGRTDINYPNLTGLYAGQLTTYWKNETDRLQSKIVFGPFSTGIPDSAHKDAWLRAKQNFDATAPRLVVKVPFTGRFSQSDAVLFWDLLDKLVLPMNGLAQTPSRFDLGVESTIEAATEFGQSFESSSWIKPALVIAGGLLLYNVFFAPARR